MLPRLLAFVLLSVLVPFAAQAQNPNQAAAQLPDGPGKELVEGACTGCHQTNMITQSSGYSREQWKELTGTMIDLAGDPDVQTTITQYLATHFPPNTKRAPKLVPGNLKVTFKEWVAPHLGQRARDPVQAADGKIWWVGQFGNTIGRLDPASGEMEELQLPPKALPHSVTLDAAGNAWYTGNGNGTVGMLDPKTNKITEYKMPDPAARDPHTAEFDKKGVLWFSLQQSDMIGRLDPKTGDVKVVKAKERSRPYGVKIDSDGNPWVACNGPSANCLYKLDPESMALTEIKLPTPGTSVRRLDIAPDGMIWYGNATQGKIGRLNPKSGEIKEWDSPSGKDSHPYGMAIVQGAVWYNESGKRPDALVRFDPSTESFQSWAVPSGGVHAGIVRHMRPTHDGKNLLIHQSSTNRIILVTIGG
jgi:virginiamycin B lyase